MSMSFDEAARVRGWKRSALRNSEFGVSVQTADQNSACGLLDCWTVVVYSKQKRPALKVDGVNALIAAAESDEERYANL